jgi:hypothetical protein
MNAGEHDPQTIPCEEQGMNQEQYMKSSAQPVPVHGAKVPYDVKRWHGLGTAISAPIWPCTAPLPNSTDRKTTRHTAGRTNVCLADLEWEACT